MATAETAWNKEEGWSSRALRDWTAPTEEEVFSISGKLLASALSGAIAFLMLGMLIGLPADLPLGYLRTGLIYLPMAWLSILLLIVIAFWSALGIVLEKPLPFMMAQALAPTGGMCAFLAIWTGAFWHKAALGSWWSGDAREIAEVLLLLIYLLIIGAPVLIENLRRADRVAAIVALCGAAQVPVVFFVAELFCSSGVSARPGGRSLELLSGGHELFALGCVTLGFWLYATYVGLLRLRCIIVERRAGVAELQSC